MGRDQSLVIWMPIYTNPQLKINQLEGFHLTR